jgi:hypothetical protein
LELNSKEKYLRKITDTLIIWSNVKIKMDKPIRIQIYNMYSLELKRDGFGRRPEGGRLSKGKGSRTAGKTDQ